MDWNLADVFETVAAAIPDAPAQRQGDRATTWRDFDRRANALAADLLDAGLTHQSKVAAYAQNTPEYLETYFAAFKGGFAPVNTNFRYGPNEVRYLFDNADAEAVVFQARYSQVVDEVRADLPKVRRWYVVDDESGERPDWATSYADVVDAGADRPSAPWGRSGDDLLLLYTGGTTGMPKGVMWRQDDLFQVLGRGGNVVVGAEPVDSLDELAARTTAAGPVMLPACPVMHGTGQFSAFIALGLGGSLVYLSPGHFDAAELWDTVEEHRVNSVVIVGDAFARPMLTELDANPGRDLSSVQGITSSGVMWSQEVKEGLLRHVPQAMLIDSYGSSEAVGMGASVSTKEASAKTAAFMLGERVKVITDDDRLVEPGSDDVGVVAITGHIPLGYYGDEEKTKATFRVVDGVRYSIPGDYAMVEADGTLKLLGRGSVCINTGGEKVFPEEVEEVLKLDERVADAVAVGVPDERFGEAICAVVEPVEGASVPEEELVALVREHLAAYKSPRHVVPVETIGRAPNGKVDYRRLKDLATERVASR
ncbi:MAG: acyl-CoA synthetase [Actinomycetota bacterium]